MNIGPLLHQIANDAQLQTILVLIAADFVFGVLAAFKLGTFQLSYVANFARNDVLGKAVPWMALDAFAIVAGHTSVLLDQLDLTNAAHGAFGVVVAAMLGSLLGSLKDLGLPGTNTIPPAAASGRSNPPTNAGV